jgi:hypothetical protein
VTPPSTPQCHSDRLRHQEQDSRVMHTPQHRRLPAQPSNADPVSPAQPSNDDPFVADAPVAGGTWQLPPINTSLMSVEDICAQADMHSANLYVRGHRQGHRRGQGSVSSVPPRILSPAEIHSLRSQLSVPPPPPPDPPANNNLAGNTVAQLRALAAQTISAPNPFAGLTAQQLLRARDSLPSSGATTPAASSSASGSCGPSRIPSHQ